MKNKFEYLIDIVRDNSKVIVPSIVMIFVIIVLFITLYFYKYNSFREKLELDFYEFVSASKVSFSGNVIRNRRGNILDFDVDDSVYIDSYPIYNDSNNMVIFPKEMNVVYASNEFIQSKSHSYSYLYYDDNDYKFNDVGFNNYIKHNFLYDGSNIYFFIDGVTISVDGRSIVLSPMSFIYVNSYNNIGYYDRDNDFYEVVDTTSNDVIVKNDYFEINVMEDKINYFGNNVLLINDFDFLKYISERE